MVFFYNAYGLINLTCLNKRIFLIAWNTLCPEIRVVGSQS